MPTIVHSVKSAVAHLLPRLAQGSRLVLIDGPSGAGKSTLARELLKCASGTTQLLSLDDVYPGWDGLAAGADEVATEAVVPLAAGRRGHWRPYDWTAGTKVAPVGIDPGVPLIIEGVGALHPLSSPLASGRAWVDAPTATRQERAFARDGDGYRPHWERWAAQEAMYFQQATPKARADIVVQLDGRDDR
ncbi:MAG: 4-amino-4-deoxy-L-arabinose transferase [Propionibacteriaceae bacterium]|nr:4-amino-4-deoxy-L-arabinose transferase [Propionibacteriaceae bacterium]